MKQKLTQEQVDQAVQMYSVDKMGTVEIGRRLNVSWLTIANRLKERGIKLTPARYKLNDDYFSKIDTEQKAYFLGLLYADGNLHRTKYITTLVLSEQDRCLVEVFREQLGTKKPIYSVKGRRIAGTDYIGKPAVKLEISSQQIHSDLISHGCSPAKSLTLKFPSTVPEDLMRHFVRGYFDGDGCIYNSQGRIMINIVGSQSFCTGMTEFLNKRLDIATIVKSERRGQSYYFSIFRIADVLKFCLYIYDRSEVKFERKYQKYIDYLKTINFQK